MDDDRIRRPDLDRKRPLRSSVRADSERPDADPDCESEDGGLIEAGVEAAYRVVDAYLREGRRVARKLGRISLPRGRDSRRYERFLELTGDLAANWFDLLGLFTESLADIDYPDSRTPEIEVTYEISSALFASARLDFFSGKATTHVRSNGLDSERAPRIPVGFHSPDEWNLVVQVRVPADQPPGVYAGVLVEIYGGVPVGALTLELRP